MNARTDTRMDRRMDMRTDACGDMRTPRALPPSAPLPRGGGANAARADGQIAPKAAFKVPSKAAAATASNSRQPVRQATAAQRCTPKAQGASPPNAPPLWRQLQVAARLVAGVRAGQSLTSQLEPAPAAAQAGQSAGVDAALRPGVQAIAFHALRWLGLAEHLRSQLAARRPPPAADALLCTALALLQPRDAPPYAGFALVSQAVEAAKRDVRLQAHAALINACLRRYLRECQAGLAAPHAVDGTAPGGKAASAAIAEPHDTDAPAVWNHPGWWVRRLRQDHPQHWQGVLRAAQARPPMVLRVNVRRIGVADFMQRLADAGLPATALGGQAVQLVQPVAVGRIPGFEHGHASVQSWAAQQAAPLLLGGWPQAGAGRAPRVLDACAAPGGKTAHLLELCPAAHVTALDADAQRAARIHANLQRLGLQADVRVADAADTARWWDGQPFDAILLDAPCSASGIVRRHPDVRWLRREGDIAQLAAEQDRLLHALWPLLRAGGRMLYATCSVFREEGDARIAAFLRHQPGACALPAPGHLLPAADWAGQGTATGGKAEWRLAAASAPGCMAAVGDNPACDDGFYYALLEKKPA